MKNFAKTDKWITRYFIPFSIVIFVIIYLRWFRLTPLVFYNDPDFAYIVGLILLGLYALFAILTKTTRKHKILQKLLFIPSAILFIGSIGHITAFFPQIDFTAKCNNKTYYITWMHPFGDYQWIFNNLTIWHGSFKYESFFFGYELGSYEIVCDDEKMEANIINTSNNVLIYTDGERPRSYNRHTKTELRHHKYFLSMRCNDWVPSTCGSITYTLYQCSLSYKSCEPLPIQYTQHDTRDTLHLSANDTFDEVNLHEEDFETDEITLIFTYGDLPQCFVKGCEIREEIK